MTWYNLAIEPFLLHGEKGTLKTQRNKVVEEAAEAFAALEQYGRSEIPVDEGIWRDVVYECCDTIQAACNLMHAVGASPADVMDAMSRVHEANAKRGRYKND